MYFLVYDFSSFHLDSLRDTVGWECVVKDDGVRSRLIKLKSFLQSKIDVDLIYSVLVFLPCIMHVLCMDAVHSSRSYLDPCVLCS